MILPSLALLVVWGVGLGPEADPAILVARLGAPKYAEREAASEALEALGREALEALRAAREAEDAEIRNRAEVLLDRIEGALLTQATLVTLDDRDQPLAEVVRSLARQTGFPLTLDLGRNSQSARRTVAAERPLPFWQAIDRLGLSARWINGLAPSPFGEGRSARLVLSEPNGPIRHCNRGPFRIELRGPGRAGRNDLSIALDVLAEPRLLLRATGPLRITEAQDDRGQAMTPSPRPEPPADFGRWRDLPTTPGPSASPHLALVESLQAPPQRGRRLERLRGFLPVEVSARKAEPQVVPLNPPDAAQGRMVPCGDITFIIQSFRRDPAGRHATLDLLAVPSEVAAGGFIVVQRGRGRWGGGAPRPGPRAVLG
ncbi:MAG: hypothetical protein IRY99_12190, partial [Isosphaeraceae bacterium]|nr:hypothetical protein [Isosphaeraceae bacterium]